MMLSVLPLFFLPVCAEGFARAAAFIPLVKRHLSEQAEDHCSRRVLQSQRHNDGSDGAVLSVFDNDGNEHNNNIFGNPAATNNDKEAPEESHIPADGVSVSDSLDEAQRDQFVTEVVPVNGLPGVAQLVSDPVLQHAFEPVRYIVALSPPNQKKRVVEKANEEDDDDDDMDICFENATFVMVDVPPFSTQLVTRIKAFMGINHTLAAILITSSDAIHYDENPSQVYSMTRRGDLLQDWKRAFPETSIVSYRLDTPRDCRDIVTQKLDGNGPFGWVESEEVEVDAENGQQAPILFEEMGRPLVKEEWDYQTGQSFMSGAMNADEALSLSSSRKSSDNNNPKTNIEDFSATAIRAREEGRKILAVHTPGHSFGTLSYVFPEIAVCCSGYTIPIEDTRRDSDDDTPAAYYTNAGPALDVRGYITTSRAGISRQMESARNLVGDYVDRFATVLPSRGDPLTMENGDAEQEERREILSDIIDQYDKIGKIYEQLGITDGMQ